MERKGIPGDGAWMLTLARGAIDVPGCKKGFGCRWGLARGLGGGMEGF